MAKSTKSSYGTVSISIVGMAEVLARLDQMRGDLQYRMLVAACKKSLQGLMALAESRTPLGPNVDIFGRQKPNGLLRRSFQIRKTRRQDPFTIEVALVNTAYTARWVEYGHKVVMYGKVLGSTRPVGFMRKAFSEGAQGVVSDLSTEVNRALLARGI